MECKLLRKEGFFFFQQWIVLRSETSLQHNCFPKNYYKILIRSKDTIRRTIHTSKLLHREVNRDKNYGKTFYITLNISQVPFHKIPSWRLIAVTKTVTAKKRIWSSEEWWEYLYPRVVLPIQFWHLHKINNSLNMQTVRSGFILQWDNNSKHTWNNN